MKTKLIGWLSLFCLIGTILWLALLVGGMTHTGSVGNFNELLIRITNLDAIFYLTYLNAALITILATALFASLYVYCKSFSPEWSEMP